MSDAPEKTKGPARGFRLQRGRVAQLRRHFTSAVSAIRAQGYQPRSDDARDPEALWAQERYVDIGDKASELAEYLGSIFTELEGKSIRAEELPRAEEAQKVLRLCYGALSAGDTLRGVREEHDRGGACLRCGLWCDEEETALLLPDGQKPLKKCDWCTEFHDAVLLARSTEAAIARARGAWSAWMLNERAWRGSHRSRTAAEALERVRAAEMAYRLEEERAAESIYPRCRSDWNLRMVAVVERARANEDRLDQVAEDVIDRAIRVRSEADDRFLAAVRREADGRLAEASLLLASAWDDVDHRTREAELEAEQLRVKGDRPTRARIASASRLLERLPAPQTRAERIAACDALLSWMRAKEAAE